MKREPKIKSEFRGDMFIVPVFECEWCGGDMGEWVEYDGDFICPECAFKNGVITEEEFIKLEVPSFFWGKIRAAVFKGEILYAYGKEKFPFEMSSNDDYRNSRQYKKWRRQVYERDNFRCQICGQVGGNLNAHHIKTFKDYPELRFELSNGITLCERCHRDLHKRIRYAGKKNVHKKNNRE